MAALANVVLDTLMASTRKSTKPEWARSYRQKGKKLIPPLLDFGIGEVSWIDEGIPELVWIAALCAQLGPAKAARVGLKMARTARDLAPESLASGWFGFASDYLDLDSARQAEFHNRIRHSAEFDDFRQGVPFIEVLGPAYATGRKAAIAAAREVYGAKCLVDIQAEEGSWKFWGAVYIVSQVLLGAYDAVSKYHDFKESVKELTIDAQKYGGRVLNSVLPQSGATAAQKESTLRRQMAPGSVYKLLNDLDSFEVDRATLSRAQAAKRIQDIERRIRRLSAELPPDDMKVIRKLVKSRGLPVPDDAFQASQPLVATKEDDFAARLQFMKTANQATSAQKISELRSGRLEMHELINVGSGQTYLELTPSALLHVHQRTTK